MISKQDIQKLSKLARIEVSESEIEKLQHDLDSVLGYVERLNRAETGTAETLIHANELFNIAADGGARVVVEADAAELLSAAPHHDKSFVKVPSVWKKK